MSYVDSPLNYVYCVNHILALPGTQVQFSIHEQFSLNFEVNVTVF